MIWYKENNNDIVISTRIRLARNIKKYPFPNAMTDAQTKEAVSEIEKTLTESNSTLSKTFKTLKLSELDEAKRGELIEKHLISPDLGKRASVMISDDECMSIMLMEEDHIRLQIIKGGFSLDEAWELADKVDDVIEENAEYAFHKDFGYLTACPTNAGTGLRASVMMHLPALTMTNNMGRIISSASNLGIAVRGLYGEGSKAYGSLYQISNQITLGLSEKELIEKLKNIVCQIKEHEENTRNNLLKNNKNSLEDRLWRAYGTLKYARSISSNETKSLISDVIMGVNMGIIPKDNTNFLQLIIETEPYTLSVKSKTPLTAEERDILRADTLRSVL